jgi:hypothetical protein
MADFRRCILALAVVALLTGVVSTASAAPFTCNATSAVPTLMRSEGLAELAGDIVLQCSGVLPAGSVNSANINVFLGNTTITSRILNTTTNASEVLLLVDEPAAPFTLGTNMFQGIISGNQVMFLGVPVVPGGTLSTGADITSRVFRITNIRANASAVGTGASGTPGQVTAFVSIAGPTSIAVNNAQQTVGFVSKGLTFAIKSAVKSTKEGDQAAAGSPTFSSAQTFAQCSGRGSTPRQNPIAAFRFTENFATAFKVRGDANQTTPGSIYNTESGLTVSSLASSGITGFTSVAGLADFGTRLRVVFNNIPNGLNIWVSQNNIWKDAPASITDAGTPLVATAVVSETVGSGTGAVTPTNTFKNANGDSDKVPVIQVSLTGGSGTAVWEVVKANPIALDFADFYFYFGYSANPASNSPATGTGTVSGSFAPISTVATASATAPIPRFADTGSAVNLVTIVACRTNLLFPFVTNQAGFDTGIAIANTSKDIFGTDAQAGTCTLNFFGDNAPAPVTSGSVAGGAVYTALAQSVAPNFQGYVIAQCGFQFGHGFAFVSDVGARNLAMGYLALVIPDQSDNSRGSQAISLDSGRGELLGQ